MSCSSTAVCRTAVPPARPSATRTYLKMFWRYATSNGINGDRNMIREAFDYKVETGTGKRNLHPTEALAILSAARQGTDPLLRWAPLVMHTPAAGSVSCWARPRLPSNSAKGFGVWRSKKSVPRRAVNSDAEGARERTSRSGSFRWRRRCWSMPRRLSGSSTLKNAPSPAEGSSHRSITIWAVLSFVTPKRSLATSGFVMKASTDVAGRTGNALWSASRTCYSRGACSCNQP